jgi:hypothetical protein
MITNHEPAQRCVGRNPSNLKAVLFFGIFAFLCSVLYGQQFYFTPNWVSICEGDPPVTFNLTGTLPNTGNTYWMLRYKPGPPCPAYNPPSSPCANTVSINLTTGDLSYHNINPSPTWAQMVNCHSMTSFTLPQSIKPGCYEICWALENATGYSSWETACGFLTVLPKPEVLEFNVDRALICGAGGEVNFYAKVPLGTTISLYKELLFKL